MSDKPPEWRRWLGIALRTLHIGGVVLLGAHLLGASAPAAQAGAAMTVFSGGALLASELADRRVRLTELAGAVALLKLVAAVGLVWASQVPAAGVFWSVLVVSAVISHAPKGLRHWQPGR